MKAIGHTFVPYGEEEQRCINGNCCCVIDSEVFNEKEVREHLEMVDGVKPQRCKWENK